MTFTPTVERNFEIKVRPEPGKTTDPSAPATQPGAGEEPEPAAASSTTALPDVPGPALQFHNPEERAPTLKEVFGQDVNSSSPLFPGKLLNP